MVFLVFLFSCALCPVPCALYLYLVSHEENLLSIWFSLFFGSRSRRAGEQEQESRRAGEQEQESRRAGAGAGEQEQEQESRRAGEQEQETIVLLTIKFIKSLVKKLIDHTNLEIDQTTKRLDGGSRKTKNVIDSIC